MKLYVMTGYYSILDPYAWDSGKCYWMGLQLSSGKTAVWAKFGFSVKMNENRADEKHWKRMENRLE